MGVQTANNIRNKTSEPSKGANMDNKTHDTLGDDATNKPKFKSRSFRILAGKQDSEKDPNMDKKHNNTNKLLKEMNVDNIPRGNFGKDVTNRTKVNDKSFRALSGELSDFGIFQDDSGSKDNSEKDPNSDMCKKQPKLQPVPKCCFFGTPQIRYYFDSSAGECTEVSVSQCCHCLLFTPGSSFESEEECQSACAGTKGEDSDSDYKIVKIKSRGAAVPIIDPIIDMEKENESTKESTKESTQESSPSSEEKRSTSLQDESEYKGYTLELGKVRVKRT